MVARFFHHRLTVAATAHLIMPKGWFTSAAVARECPVSESGVLFHRFLRKHLLATLHLKRGYNSQIQRCFCDSP